MHEREKLFLKLNAKQLSCLRIALLTFSISFICFTSFSFKKYYPALCNQHTPKRVCGTSVVLEADAGQSNYTWSTGETSPNITVSSTGTYWWETVDMSNNKVANGDFSGSRLDNERQFTSSYNYVIETGNTGGSGALQAEGYYSITTNPRITHTNFASFTDHSPTGTGNHSMMVVNGAPANNVSIWQQNITISPNTDYIFSVWFTSVSPASPGRLSFSINGTNLGAPIILTSGTPDWKNYTVRWNSGNSTTATIGIVNQNTAASGNDFALDDLSFAPVCRNYFDVTITPNPSKPSITP